MLEAAIWSSCLAAGLGKIKGGVALKGISVGQAEIYGQTTRGQLRKGLRTLGLILLLTLAGCAQSEVAATPPPVTITIAGSTAMTPVLTALTGEFNHRHPQAIFSLRGGGSTLGEQWAAAGQVDLAASNLLPPEMIPDTDPPTPVQAKVVRVPMGVDGVAIIVHPRNDVAVLTLLQLRDLFSGHLLSWKDVGSDLKSDDGVLLISREDGSGTRLFFEEQVMGDERVALTAVVMPTSQDVVAYVADHPQAIGYVSAAWLRDSRGDLLTDPDAPVRIVPVEGQLPTLDNLRQQRYHLAHPIFLVSRAEPTGWVKQFVDFVLSPAGQQIVAKFHAPIR